MHSAGMSKVMLTVARAPAAGFRLFVSITVDMGYPTSILKDTSNPGIFETFELVSIFGKPTGFRKT